MFFLEVMKKYKELSDEIVKAISMKPFESSVEAREALVASMRMMISLIEHTIKVDQMSKEILPKPEDTKSA